MLLEAKRQVVASLAHNAVVQVCIKCSSSLDSMMSDVLSLNESVD